MRILIVLASASAFYATLIGREPTKKNTFVLNIEKGQYPRNITKILFKLESNSIL